MKLQKNKTGYVGSWKNDTYSGKGLYISHDESIQEGQLEDGKFNGVSRQVTAGGKTAQGKWVNDFLVEHSSNGNQN